MCTFPAAKYTPPQPKLKICPVAKLSPYREEWVIKAHVENKTIQLISNQRGEWSLFSVKLVDESGEIKATAFNQECEKFYGLITEGREYFISQCKLKPENKRYSEVNHDYQMTFTNQTIVIPVTSPGETFTESL
ncbi:replication protein A 70 kDa DNA-binding subunit-like [Schistocerca piceifrons]|uniref:replication protein A 70 kDa DNA-binding subunit-like n=1 Tax=Schistocerca piceifrons TaxID=274613 RepID=UPI001F5F4556|nr:replication protein A 70 kDa DNA-binding subunit-like [Schistocerca piceifrons]